MNRSALALALARFLEANRQIDADRVLRPLERGYEKKLATWFTDQGEAVVKALSKIAPLFDVAVTESTRLREVSPAEWEYLVDGAMMGRSGDFIEFASQFTFQSLMAGYTALVEDVGDVGISFELDNPRAVAYANEHAAALVKQIDDVTRGYLRTIISQATTEGWSWTRVQQTIEARYKEFATGGDNPRSRRIARFEMRDAYEGGNDRAAQDMVKAGLKMEKSWLSIGDEKVRPSHQANQGQGWIPLEATFGTGDLRSPTDPGCRCVMLYRRAR